MATKTKFFLALTAVFVFAVFAMLLVSYSDATTSSLTLPGNWDMKGTEGANVINVSTMYYSSSPYHQLYRGEYNLNCEGHSKRGECGLSACLNSDGIMWSGECQFIVEGNKTGDVNDGRVSPVGSMQNLDPATTYKFWSVLLDAADATWTGTLKIFGRIVNIESMTQSNTTVTVGQRFSVFWNVSDSEIVRVEMSGAGIVCDHAYGAQVSPNGSTGCTLNSTGTGEVKIVVVGPSGSGRQTLTRSVFINASSACGNGTINSGEQCDGGNLGGQSCSSRGYAGGTLSCNAPGTPNQCQFNTSSCGRYKCSGSGSACVFVAGDTGGNQCSPPNDSFCSASSPVNGSCSASHYNCNAGTSANNVDGASAWTWTCNGLNGGSNASCSETKPASCTASCGSCSVSCGGGTQTCTRSDCSTYTQSCNTQACSAPPPTVDLQIDGLNGPMTVAYNSTHTLAWNVSGAQSCYSSSAWLDAPKSPSGGSEPTGPITTSGEWRLACFSGPNGTGLRTNDSVTVNVSAPPPTVDLQIDGLNGPMTVAYNSTHTLAWNVSGAQSCYSSSAWRDAPKSPIWGGGPESTGPITTSGNWVLSCFSGPNGTGTRTQDYVTVNVSAPPPTLDLKADGSYGPITKAYGSSAQLTWNTTNAVSCYSSSAWRDASKPVNNLSPGESTGPLTTSGSGNWILTCFNGPNGTGDRIQKYVTINVSPPPPTLDLKADGSYGPITKAYGSSAQLTWNTTNAVSCYSSSAWRDASKPVNNLSPGESTGPLTTSGSGNWILTCFNGPNGTGDRIQKYVTINVSAPPAPTVTISAFPNPVNYNSASTVTWSSTNTTPTCTVNGTSYSSSSSDTTGPLTGDRTYTIICQGLDGSTKSASVTVTVRSPTVTISTNPTSVAYGGSSTISWSSSNASSCTKSGDWSGSTPPNVAGTQSVGPLTIPSPKTYTLTCSGNGSVSQSASVTVGAAPTMNYFRCNGVDTPGTCNISYGGTAALTWSSSNTTICSLVSTVPTNDSVAPSGSRNDTGIIANRDYSIECWDGVSGVHAPPLPLPLRVVVGGPTVTISANPPSIAYGGSSTISWSSSNASSCTKSGDWSGSTPPNVAGSQPVGPLNPSGLSGRTYTYTLTCNGNGSTIRSATVTVSSAPAPTVTISAFPNPVNYNSASTVTWSSTNTTPTCTVNGTSYPSSSSDTTGPLASNRTYTIICQGLDGSSPSAAVTVSVNGPTVSISASPTSVNYNGSSSILWTVSNASSCTASGAWSGSKDSSNGTHSQSTGPLTTDRTYIITCSGANGSTAGPVSASVNINAPSVSISASSTSVVYGGSSTISWSSSSVGSCTKSGDWSGSTPPNVSGSQSVGPLNQVKTYTYTLTCSGSSSVARSATVSVTAPSPTTSNVTITEPNYCASGPAVTMSWSYSDPTGSPQRAYQVQLDDSGSFGSVNVDSGKTLSGSNSWFSGQGVLSFNSVYHARVRTWSGFDIPSSWQKATICSGPGCTGGGADSWKTPAYAYPQIDFNWMANSILNNPSPPLNKPVQFTDATVFDGNPLGRRWSWQFGDGATSTSQNPSHIYTAEGTYYVSLTATDNANQSCNRACPTHQGQPCPLIIQKPIPKWREVAPR